MHGATWLVGPVPVKSEQRHAILVVNLPLSFLGDQAMMLRKTKRSGKQLSQFYQVAICLGEGRTSSSQAQEETLELRNAICTRPEGERRTSTSTDRS